MDKNDVLLLETRQAAEVLGMETWQIQSYAKQGFVESDKPVRGSGGRRVYNAISLFKLSLLNQLSKDGFDIRTIRDIFNGLFEFPVREEQDPAAYIQEYFEDKLLITCDRFLTRKLVRYDRLTGVMEELMETHRGLYVIDIGGLAAGMLVRLSKFQN